MSQGQGLSTRRKEERFRAVFALSLGVSKAVSFAKYWHIDLNAGSGWNEECDCPGSPVVFLEVAEEMGRSFQAFFCDSNVDYLKELQGRVYGWIERFDEAGIEIMPGDNGEALATITQRIRDEDPRPELAIGTCVCDPNGPKNGFPGKALEAFAADFPRIDLVLNVNVRVWRAAVGAREKAIKGFEDWMDLGDAISRFNKKLWMVSNPPRVQGDCFSIFYGTNANIKETSFQGFHSLRSREGQQILRAMNHVNVGQQHFPWMET